MENERKGVIKLLSLPKEPDALLKVEQYLLKFSRNPEKDKPMVKAMLSKLPAVIARNTPQKNAEKIVSSLQKLGARAVYEISEAAQQKPSAPAKKPSAPAQKPSAPAKKPSAPARKPSAAPPPPSPTPPPKHAPPQEMRSVKAPTGDNMKLVYILAGVLVLAAGANYFFNPSGQKAPVAKKVAQSKKQAPKESQPPEREVEWTLPPGGALEYYDMTHAPPYDKRLADGLAEAVREYARLFPDGGAVDVRVEYKAEHMALDDWKLTYDIQVNNSPAQVTAILTNDPDRIAQNIPVLKHALEAAVGAMGSAVMRPEAINTIPPYAQDIYEDIIWDFNSFNLFNALNQLGEKLGPESVSPGAFRTAGVLFSWLAYSANARPRDNVNRIAGKYAVANQLMAEIFEGGAKEEMEAARGLLWMGLGYPGAALAEVAGKAAPGKDLVRAMATRDMENLKDAARKADLSTTLYGYLKARLGAEADSCCGASEHMKFLTEKHPKFGIGMEYIIKRGGPEYARQAEAYAMQENSLLADSALNWLVPSESSVLPAAKQAYGMAQSTSGAPVEDMVKALKLIIESSPQLMGEEKLLTKEFVVSYLEEASKDTLFLCFLVERDTLARPKAADRWALTINTLWPGSQLGQLASIQMAQEKGDYEKVENLVKQVSLGQADPILLRWTAWLHISKDGSVDRVAKNARILGIMRNTINPSAKALMRAAGSHRESKYIHVAEDYKSRAKKLDPYNPGFYWEAFERGDEKQANVKNSPLARSSNFLWAAARWMREQGRAGEAESFYKMAMKASPGSDNVARDLADMYMEKNDYANAEKTLADALQTDDGSFKYVHARNKLAEVYLAMGNHKKALSLMEKTLPMGQGGTMDQYARAAEALGDMATAEEYFSIAAERYSTGWAPRALGMFHLRRGDLPKAAGAFARYRKSNVFNYYFTDAIKHFSEQGTPGQTLDLVKQVEGNDLPAEVAMGLSDRLLQAGFPKEAAEAMRTQLGDGSQRKPFYIHLYYIRAMAKVDPAGTKELVNQAKVNLSFHKNDWQWLAMGLSQDGFYEEAFDLYAAWAKEFPAQAEEGTVLMAASWKSAGGADERMRKTLEDRLAKMDKTKWRGVLVRYYLGGASEEELLAQVTNPNKAVHAYFAMATYRIASGNIAEADKLMALTLETGKEMNPVYSYAFHYMRQNSEQAKEEYGADYSL